MKIYSTRLGEIEIEESDIIHFPYALPGFPEEKGFIMFGYEPQTAFYLMQSTITPELTFVLVNPFEFFQDYQFKLDEETTGELDLSEDNPPEVYAIVTVPADAMNMTANLIAPVVINRQKKVAIQVVLDKSGYNTRHRLFEPGETAEPSGKETK